MHDDEIDVTTATVRSLVASQFPQWASRPVHRIPSAGTANAIFRLGDDLVARLPLAPRFEERDQTACWLAALPPALPLAIPEPVVRGEPDESYPCRWSVHRWIEGETWQPDRVEDRRVAATQLGDFILALQNIDPSTSGCPTPRDVGSVVERTAIVRVVAAKAPGVDAKAVLDAWDEAVSAPRWTGPPVLVHWDLFPGNVIVRRGRLVGVIDWGELRYGDPSRDLMAAWTLFSGEARTIFRSALAFDEDTWMRARGWPLAFVVGVAYYEHTNPAFAHDLRRALLAVLDDRPSGE